MAADPQSTAQLSMSDFVRILERHSFGLAEEDIEVLGYFFSHVPTALDETQPTGDVLADTSANALNIPGNDPKAKATATGIGLTGLFKSNKSGNMK